MGHVPIAWKKTEKSKEVHDDSRNQCPREHQADAREGEGGRAFQRGREVPAAGKKVLDESLKPMIYNEEARAVLFDFIQKKANTQYGELRQKNLKMPWSGWMSPG